MAKAKALAQVSIQLSLEYQETEVLIKVIPIVIKKAKITDKERAALQNVYNSIISAVLPGTKQENPVEEDEPDDQVEDAVLPTTWSALKEIKQDEDRFADLLDYLGLPEGTTLRAVAPHLGIVAPNRPINKKKKVQSTKPFADPRSKLRVQPGKLSRQPGGPLIRDI